MHFCLAEIIFLHVLITIEILYVYILYSTVY